MQILLDLCTNYAKMWDLKFNEKKGLLFGENELIINIESDYIYSVIGLKKDKVFRHHAH